MTATASATPDPRPILAIVNGHLTPYREHFHRRVVGEIPELRLATLVTKHRTNQWVNRHVPEINTVMFDPEPGPGEGASLLSRSRHEFGIARRLCRWLDEHRPAAVVCSGYDEIPNVRAARWANRHRVPALLVADSNVHGDLARGPRRIAKDLILRRLCRKYGALLVCGTVGRRYFHRYGVPDERMFLMPYEPDYNLIRSMPPAKADAVAASLGLAPGRRRLVCCCRLIAVKRVDLVIDAFAKLAAERPDWDLVIVGDGELRPQLEASVPEALRERVKFLGFQDQETVSCIYLRSDALVLASDYEPWALVVNEAAAAGLALVTTDRVGAAYELVRDGRNGRMVPAGDAAALLNALRDVTDSAHIDAYKRASSAELERWRREADPIAGLRAALAHCAVIGPRPAASPAAV